MDIGDFFAGLFIVLVVSVVVALLAFTAAFFVSIGVWPIVAWGWFAVLVVGSGISFAVAGDF